MILTKTRSTGARNCYLASATDLRCDLQYRTSITLCFPHDGRGGGNCLVRELSAPVSFFSRELKAWVMGAAWDSHHSCVMKLRLHPRSR